MNKIAFVLACLACAGLGRRVQSSASGEQAGAEGAGALANLLLASGSDSAFNPSAPGAGTLSRRQALLAVPAAALLLPNAAQAAIPTIKFVGSYIDPFHPGCERKLKVDGKDAVITGTDEVGGPTWSVKAKVSDTGLLVDFSPKGGPTEVPAEWLGDAFKFPDGNVWSKITDRYRKLQIRVGSSYYDLNKIGSQYKIFVSKAGVSIDGSEGLGKEKWQANGYFVGPGEIEFDKGGTKFRAKWNGDGMKFEDGTQWSEQRIASVPR
mmetsp:Transcript_157968/g.294693  ORF Transcript_157968/g.294693 Transcript_157968/m.294693 type:complete len:265 (-) Transcript_157968:52-846(-)